jgi:allophanate hydrolase subunit 2
VLPVGEPESVRRGRPPAALDLEAAICVVPGPDLERFDASALGLLLASEFRVDPRSDRVGTRLAGPALPRVRDDLGDLGPSCPMVRGAIQVPPSGAPIVMGPDHPTTGGYPVLATVVVASLGALGARPAGAVIRFVAVR